MSMTAHHRNRRYDDSGLPVAEVAGRCRLAEQRLRGVRPSRAAEQSDARGDAQHEQRQPPPVHRVDAPA
jgi:hypothetical protein